MGQIAIEIVGGALLAILTTIAIEALRKPKLSLFISGPFDTSYDLAPARKARFLSVEVLNHKLPWFAKWMSRNAALNTHGTISFHHLEGQNMFGRSMTFRWSGSPEPVLTMVPNTSLAFFDPNTLALSTSKDIYPGESARLDVAARFDNEPDAYGWSNDNYFSQPVWRAPQWKLAAGRYLVKVTVVTSGDAITKLFRLSNDVGQEDFRIDHALKQDKA